MIPATRRIRAFVRARRCVVCAERLGRCTARICLGCAVYWRYCERCKQPEVITALCTPAARTCARPGCSHIVGDGRRRLCPGCLAEWKYCAGCDRAKPHADFAKNVRGPSGLNSYCALCHAKRTDRKRPDQPVIRKSERRMAMLRFGERINHMLALGATWDEVAAETGLSAGAAKQRWYKWCAYKQQEGTCAEPPK